jgi:hypothetical protein
LKTGQRLSINNKSSGFDMKTLLFTAFNLFLVCSIPAAEQGTGPASANAIGKWASEFDTPVGHLKCVYELKSKGDQVVGTATRERDGEKTETELTEVSVDKDQVSFVEPIKIQDRDVRIEYKGKLSGDEIKFTRKVGDFASMEIVARRIRDSASSIDGKWKTEFDSQVGKQTYTYELKADGEKLTGKAIGESQFGKFDTAITEGKITPDGVSFVEMLKLPDREIRIDYSGKLSGDSLKLTRKVGDFATEEIVAKRMEAAGSK